MSLSVHPVRKNPHALRKLRHIRIRVSLVKSLVRGDFAQFHILPLSQQIPNRALVLLPVKRAGGVQQISSWLYHLRSLQD